MRWGLRVADVLTHPLVPHACRPDRAEVRRLLLIRQGSFGDLILLLPALERARVLFPRAQITLLVRERYRAFLEQVRPPVALWSVESWWQAACVPPLNYDAALDFHADPRCLLLGRRHARWLAGSGIRGGGAWLDCEVPFPRFAEAAQRWVGMVEAAAGVPLSHARVRPRVRLAAEWQTAGQQCWPAAAPAPVLLHPGCGTPAKRWPLAFWVGLARRCVAQGWPLLIVGGPADAALGATLAGRSGGSVVSLAGATGWDALAGLAARARAVVAPDTGIIHLARALGTPTLALFGPQSPAVWGAAGWGGAGRDPRHLSLAHPLACSFCGRGRCACLHPPQRYSPCMQALDVDQVWQALLAVLRPAACIASA